MQRSYKLQSYCEKGKYTLKRKVSETRWIGEKDKKEKNFLKIVWHLARYGASSSQEIAVEIFGDIEKTHYNVINRLMVGCQQMSIEGLIDKGIIRKVNFSNESRYKNQKFELSYYGVFYAILLFFPQNLRNKIFDEDKDLCRLVKPDVTIEINILDHLAKNYSHLLPLIFGKWEELKKNKEISVYNLVHLATPHSLEHLKHEMVSSTVHMFTNNKDYKSKVEIQVTFFLLALELKYDLNFLSLDEEIRYFIKWMLFERKNYYGGFKSLTEYHYVNFVKSTEKSIDKNNTIFNDETINLIEVEVEKSLFSSQIQNKSIEAAWSICEKEIGNKWSYEVFYELFNFNYIDFLDHVSVFNLYHLKPVLPYVDTNTKEFT